MKDYLVFVIVGALYLATVYALVRPGSKGNDLVKDIFAAFDDLVRGAAGYSYDKKSNAWSAPAK